MSKLLSANFARLKINKLFWIGIVLILGFGLVAINTNYQEHIKYNLDTNLDGIFFVFSPAISIILAVFISIFVGSEYSNGTIRNKLIIGHSRLNIYFANLITNISVSLFLTLSFLIGMFAVGMPLLGFMKADIKTVLLVLLGTIILNVTFCSIFTAVSMVCSNKTASAIISILGLFGLLMFTISITQRLNSPEFFTVQYTDEIIQNSQYLRGTKRDVYEFFNIFLPTGQSLHYTLMYIDNITQMILYSILITFTTTTIGALVFTKKDIK